MMHICHSCGDLWTKELTMKWVLHAIAQDCNLDLNSAVGGMRCYLIKICRWNFLYYNHTEQGMPLVSSDR
jgi:hypothetical protein